MQVYTSKMSLIFFWGFFFLSLSERSI